MLKNISEQRPTGSLRVRQNFAKIPQVIDIPNLIEIQKKSFEYFLQMSMTLNYKMNFLNLYLLIDEYI